GVEGVESRIAVPLMALGQLIGVLVAESRQRAAFSSIDEQVLGAFGAVLANAIEAARAIEAPEVAAAPEVTAPPTAPAATTAETNAVHVRYFDADGSAFVDGDYLIKGVAGRILWSLLSQHDATGRTEFTN